MAVTAADYRKKRRYDYVSDDGTTYAVTLKKAIGDQVELGFAPWTVKRPNLPTGYVMRFITIQAQATGRIRRYPVGTPEADAWTGEDVQLSLADQMEEDAILWDVVAYTGEHRRVQADIIS